MKAQFNIGDRVTIRIKASGGLRSPLSGKRGEVIDTSFIGALAKGDLVHLIWLPDETRHWVRPDDLERTPIIDALADIGDRA